VSASFAFFNAELERVATRGENNADEASPEREGRVAGVLAALRAVGLLGAEEAEAWRRLTGPAVERPTPSDMERQLADELLHDLLEAVPVDDTGRRHDALRFEGAVSAL
jgi:hypothetical protein